MNLQNEKQMECLAAHFHFEPTPMYEDPELNMSINYATLIENHRQALLQMESCSISDVLYGQYYWVVRFLGRYARVFDLREQDRYKQYSEMRSKSLVIIVEMDDVGVCDHDWLDYIDGRVGFYG